MQNSHLHPPDHDFLAGIFHDLRARGRKALGELIEQEEPAVAGCARAAGEDETPSDLVGDLEGNAIARARRTQDESSGGHDGAD